MRIDHPVADPAMADDPHRRLERTKRQFRQAERLANIGYWRLTLADNRTEWSDQVFAIHGLPVGLPPALDGALDFYPAEARARLVAAMDCTIKTGQPMALDLDFITARGEPRRVRVMAEIEIIGGEPQAMIGVFQDITDQYRIEQSLRRIAATDDLTGINNRASLTRYLANAMVAARSNDTPLALLLIDLDSFKAVNDRYGHVAGDTLLRTAARRLRSPDLAGCFAARLGGDEFVIVVDAPDDCVRLDALVTALLADLCLPIVHNGDAIETSSTIGVAWFDPALRSPTDLIERADVALYNAKNVRRGSAYVFGRGPVDAGPHAPRPVAAAVRGV